MDWITIKNEYITTNISMRKLAEKYGANPSTLTKKACKERWIEERSEICNKIATAVQQKSATKTVAKAVARIDRINNIADKLLDKLEKAVDELDIQLVTDSVKTKTIEYKNTQRPDKPTKEIVVDKSEIISVNSIVDKNGLRQITAALKDIRDIKGVRAEIDLREQEARIASLQAAAAKNASGVADDTETGVILIAPVIADDGDGVENG